MTIEFSNEQLVALKAKAAAQGLTLQDWLHKLAGEEPEPAQPGQPFKSGYGMLAKYGRRRRPRKATKIAGDVSRLRRRFLMIAGVADTHAALWYLFGDFRLSVPASSAFESAANSRRKILLSVISLAVKALGDPNHVLQEAPVTVEIIDAMLEVPRVDIPDMPDRIVAATALYFGVPAISRDRRIRTSNVQTVW